MKTPQAKRRYTRVATVAMGYSHFDDKVWNWLSNNSDYFENDQLKYIPNGFDRILAWGLLSLAGCDVTAVGTDEGVPEIYAKDWGEGVNITFKGTITELIKRLDELIA